MASSKANTPPPRPTSSDVSPISPMSTDRDIMVSSPDPRGIKRKDSETPSSESQDHTPKKLKALDLDSGDDTSTISTERSTSNLGGTISPLVDDKAYSEDVPENIERATSHERTKGKRAEEMEQKKRNKEEENRAKREIEEYEQKRMETNFAETMREHESIRRQGQLSHDDLMKLQPPEAETSPPREEGFYDIVGFVRPPKQLHHFATKKSKRAMHAAEVVRQEQAWVIAEAVRRRNTGDGLKLGPEEILGDCAEAGLEQRIGNSSKVGQEMSNGDSSKVGQELSNSSFVKVGQGLGNGNFAKAGQSMSNGASEKAKSVAFAEEVEVRTFSDESGPVASSDEDENDDEIGSKASSAVGYGKCNVQYDSLKDAPEDTKSDNCNGLTITPANPGHGKLSSQNGPADLHVVRAEVVTAANNISSTGLTDRIEQSANSRLRGPASIKTNESFEHNVVHTGLELSNVALFASESGTADPDYPEGPRARLIHVTLEDQFDKLESIILDGLGHGDLKEVFASNFLMSLTMRFYSAWVDLSKDWHFWGNTRSVEAVRLDIDLVKWIYRVLWHSTNENTFWDATGVLRVRRDEAWTRRERRDSIDSNATEPESGDHGAINALGEPINIEEPRRNGKDEQKKEVEWALKTSWLEWARENELGRLYSEEDIHMQRTMWMLLVAEYSILSRYGPHHTYMGETNDAQDDNDNAGHNGKENPYIIDDNDSDTGDDDSTDTDNEDDVDLVITRANYRNQRAQTPHPFATGGSKTRSIPIDNANDATRTQVQSPYHATTETNNPTLPTDSALLRWKRTDTLSRPSLIVKLKINPVKLAVVTGNLLTLISPSLIGASGSAAGGIRREKWEYEVGWSDGLALDEGPVLV